MSSRHPSHRRVNKHVKTLQCECGARYTRADHFERHQRTCGHSSKFVAASDPMTLPPAGQSPLYCSCGVGFTATHAFIRHRRETGHDGDWVRSRYQPRGHQPVPALMVPIDVSDTETIGSPQDSPAPEAPAQAPQTVEHVVAGLPIAASPSTGNSSPLSSVPSDDKPEVPRPGLSERSPSLDVFPEDAEPTKHDTPMTDSTGDHVADMSIISGSSLSMDHDSTTSEPGPVSTSDTELVHEVLQISSSDTKTGGEKAEEKGSEGEKAEEETPEEEQEKPEEENPGEENPGEENPEEDKPNNQKAPKEQSPNYDSDLTDDEAAMRQLSEESGQTRPHVAEDIPESDPVQPEAQATDIAPSHTATAHGEQSVSEDIEPEGYETDTEPLPCENATRPPNPDVPRPQIRKQPPRKPRSTLHKLRDGLRKAKEGGIKKLRNAKHSAWGFVRENRKTIGVALLAALAGAYCVGSSGKLPTPTSVNSQQWQLDSTAMYHIARDASVFSDKDALYQACPSARKGWPCNWSGDVPLTFDDGKTLVLENALYRPGTTNNVVSLHRLGKSGLEASWSKEHVTIHNASNGNAVGRVLFHQNGYQLHELAKPVIDTTRITGSPEVTVSAARTHHVAREEPQMATGSRKRKIDSASDKVVERPTKRPSKPWTAVASAWNKMTNTTALFTNRTTPTSTQSVDNKPSATPITVMKTEHTEVPRSFSGPSTRSFTTTPPKMIYSRVWPGLPSVGFGPRINAPRYALKEADKATTKHRQATDELEKKAHELDQTAL